MNSVLGYCSDCLVNGAVFKLKLDEGDEKAIWLAPLMEDGSVSKEIIPFPDHIGQYKDLGYNTVQLVHFVVTDVFTNGRLGISMKNIVQVGLEREGRETTLDEAVQENSLHLVIKKLFEYITKESTPDETTPTD